MRYGKQIILFLTVSFYSVFRAAKTAQIKLKDFLIRRFEIIERFYNLDNFGGGRNVVDNIIHCFICHRALVKRFSVHAGGVNAFHALDFSVFIHNTVNII